ncbi:MAG: Rnase Y domain-containing protein, partial [Nitrospinaceae bacterium]|nr:Rnase Y domain-containing protein [Nitrospinaceae bacterium]
MSFALVIGYAIGYFLRKMFTEYQIKEAEERGKKIIHEADKEVENRLKSAEIEGREKSLVVKAEFEKKMKDRQDSLRNLENDLERKDRDLNAENQKFQIREKELEEQNSKLADREKGIDQQKSEYQNLVAE